MINLVNTNLKTLSKDANLVSFNKEDLLIYSKKGLENKNIICIKNILNNNESIILDLPHSNEYSNTYIHDSLSTEENLFILLSYKNKPFLVKMNKNLVIEESTEIDLDISSNSKENNNLFIVDNENVIVGLEDSIKLVNIKTKATSSIENLVITNSNYFLFYKDNTLAICNHNDTNLEIYSYNSKFEKREITEKVENKLVDCSINNDNIYLIDGNNVLSIDNKNKITRKELSGSNELISLSNSVIFIKRGFNLLVTSLENPSSNFIYLGTFNKVILNKIIHNKLNGVSFFINEDNISWFYFKIKELSLLKCFRVKKILVDSIELFSTKYLKVGDTLECNCELYTIKEIDNNTIKINEDIKNIKENDIINVFNNNFVIVDSIEGNSVSKPLDVKENDVIYIKNKDSVLETTVTNVRKDGFDIKDSLSFKDKTLIIKNVYSNVFSVLKTTDSIIELNRQPFLCKQNDKISIDNNVYTIDKIEGSKIYTMENIKQTSSNVAVILNSLPLDLNFLFDNKLSSNISMEIFNGYNTIFHNIDNKNYEISFEDSLLLNCNNKSGEPMHMQIFASNKYGKVLKKLEKTVDGKNNEKIQLVFDYGISEKEEIIIRIFIYNSNKDLIDVIDKKYVNNVNSLKLSIINKNETITTGDNLSLDLNISDSNKLPVNINITIKDRFGKVIKTIKKENIGKIDNKTINITTQGSEDNV